MSKNTLEKLDTLFAAAEYDVCAPTPSMKNRSKTLPGIYIARSSTGACIPLFKVLLTNSCEYNCLYCANRKNRDVQRSEMTPEELTRTFMDYYHKGYVKGLFLSSAIKDNAELTMDKMIKCCDILRNRYQYKEYIHLKILPGTSDAQMQAAAGIADRLSINLEAPNADRLKKMAPQKDYFGSLLNKLGKLAQIIQSEKISYDKNRRLIKKTKSPSITTQLVVGAAGETDREILERVDQVKKDYLLRRIYFSAFTPISHTPLENMAPTPKLREHRLYQADWLFSYYNFKLEDICLEKDGNLSITKDPKLCWAENNPGKFPIEINTADSEQLLHIPGIGPVSANRILESRKKSKLNSLEELRSLGAVTKRAGKFILINGKQPKESDKKAEQEQLLPLDL